MRLVLIALLTVLAGCAGPSGSPAPAPASQPQAMVAAANPQAVEAGLEVLRAGGTATDAAVAVTTVLGLVEPQSSGLGGGAFMLVYDAASRRISAYDGRETAPASATPDMFLQPNGEPLSFQQAVLSGRSTGAPSVVAMLGLAHRDHGRRPWATLFEPGVRLADQGFLVSPRLGRFANGNAAQAKTPDATAYFTKPDGTRIQVGDRHRNPAYAGSLRAIAANGSRALLEGPIAERIVAKVAEAPRPGGLTARDLAAYQPKRVEPVCRPWRIYIACSTPPPSSGAALIQLLLMLEHTPIERTVPTDARGWFLFAEASRLMYADRDRYFADPAFVRVPVEGLLDPAYVARRAALIGDRAAPAVEPGVPAGAAARARDATLEPAGTSHFVIVDRWGNVVSMTATVESIFGSGRMVGGFFLNNELTDFSFRPRDEAGRAAANAVAPGKRPRSSMSPIILLDREGRFVAALGSPGGTSIPAYIGKTIVAAFYWGLPLQQAVALPNLIARGNRVATEPQKFAPGVVEGLVARGLPIRPEPAQEESGVHAVRRIGNALEGAADPRRDGEARSP